MATQKQTSKKTQTKKAGVKKTAKAPAKSKQEDLVVFAFRLTPAERDAIHKTAGPRNATRLVRQVAVAFAREDEKGFREVLKEAKNARA